MITRLPSKGGVLLAATITILVDVEAHQPARRQADRSSRSARRLEVDGGPHSAVGDHRQEHAR